MKIGLLPFYIALYDEVSPHARPRLETFYEQTAQRLESLGFSVVRTGFCRLKPEFEAAVEVFERAGVRCLVTMHMAYSPSLESAEVLCKTRLPVVVLDVTDTYDFGSTQTPNHILYCHGIHGVMDMCSLLRQNGKPFAVAAGHPDESDVMRRAAGLIRAAAAAFSLTGSRVGCIGGSFDGMGDFAVMPEELHARFGVETVVARAEDLKSLENSVTEVEIEAEIRADREAFEPIGAIPYETHAVTVRSGLAVRKWVEREKLSAFSVNFLKIGPAAGLSAMPFPEACKSMARGIGYAGEGDVLTASFVGAFLQSFPETSFIEIFCPDWKGNTLLLSHMGEMNIRLTAAKPEMFEKSFILKNVPKPLSLAGCFKSGSAVFANVCKTTGGFRLVFSEVTAEAEQTRNFAGTVRGWMRPKIPVHTFLEELSRAGATHHSILIYGAESEQLRFFAELTNLEAVEI